MNEMRLDKVIQKLKDLELEYGSDVEVRSYYNKSADFSIFYDEDDDRIYVDV